MSILIVEDNKTDVAGIVLQCSARGWEYEVCPTFWLAAERLVDCSRSYSLVVLDTILPWGEQVPDVVINNYPNERAGLYLLQAMRECGDGAVIMSTMDLSPMNMRHVGTRVLVLSRLLDIEEECKNLDVLRYYTKIDYSFREFIALVEGVIGDGL